VRLDIVRLLVLAEIALRGLSGGQRESVNALLSACDIGHQSPDFIDKLVEKVSARAGRTPS